MVGQQFSIPKEVADMSECLIFCMFSGCWASDSTNTHVDGRGRDCPRRGLGKMEVHDL